MAVVTVVTAVVMVVVMMCVGVGVVLVVAADCNVVLWCGLYGVICRSGL